MTNNKYLGKSGLALLLALLLCPKTVQSNDFNVPQSSEIAITLDGKLDEAFWQDAQKLSLNYETEPQENTTPEVSTHVYILQDQDYLYLGFDAQDNNPQEINASYQDRDGLGHEDYVGILLDTFNDQRRAYKFLVNPLGIQADSIQDEVLDREDHSWNAIWFSAGAITETGYQVEIKIPFKILRFSDDKKLKDWSLNFVRNYPRKYQYRYSYTKNNRNDACELCQFAKVTGFKDIDSGNNLELTPVVTSQRHDNRSRNQAWQEGDFENEAGLDARWGVTDNSVINLTINPDFSQVESDAVQFDVNTQFALFYPENRPFFLEGDDFFNTQLTTFYSRNIAEPKFGAKYTGKEGDGSIGFLYVRDELTNIILPGTYGASLVSLQENNLDSLSPNLESSSAAFRYAHDVSSDMVLGASMTHRSAGDYSNNLVNLDGRHQLTESDMLRYQVIFTETEYPTDIQGQEQKISGNAYRINYKHDDRDWSWFLSHNIFDQDFRADLGFLTRVGYRKSVLGGYRRWYGDKADFWSRVQIGGDWDITYDEAGNKIEQEAESRMNFRGKYQSGANVLLGTRDKFHTNSSFDLGRWFEQDYWSLSYELRPWTDLGLGFYIGQSDEIDFLNNRPGNTEDYSLWMDWQLGLHFNLELSAERQTFDLDASDSLEAGSFYEADALNAKLVYQFNEKSYLRFLLRYEKIEFDSQYFILRSDDYCEGLARQLLYAYKLDAKSVLYVGYSDGQRDDEFSRSTFKNSKDIFVKFSYAFQF